MPDIAAGQGEVITLHLAGKLIDIQAVCLSAVLVYLYNDLLLFQTFRIDIGYAIDT